MLILSNFFVPVFAEDFNSLKKVLIINSYHEGLPWTKDETDGIIEGFKKSGDNYSTFFEYMDWKNYPTQENLHNLYDYFKFKYKNNKIDILIATDDIALEFALKYRKELFSDAPVVFCGVNMKGIGKIAKDYDNLTGVMEDIDPAYTIEMAMDINPGLKNVYVMYDNSESGLSTGDIVINGIRALNKGLNVIPLNNLAYEDVIKKVKNLDDNSIVFITTYYSDVNGRVIDFKYLSREISLNSTVPVYHLYDMGLNNGAIGGNMMSGKLQGEYAANMALQILDGKAANEIPYISERTNRKVFDYNQLKRFGIPLNKVSKDVEIVNKPFSFFETYRTLVISVIAAFLVLIVFVWILLFYIAQIKKIKISLQDSYQELEATYEELTAAQDELKEKYNKIIENDEKIRNSEERLLYLAYYDSLTGLPNKQSLYENTYREIFSVQYQQAALMFIDMDHFKYINDTMGHDSGDKLIIKVSERLISILKEGSSVYRLSGDEFVITMKNIEGQKDAEALANLILSKFKEEFIIVNSVLHVTLSIGIALYPEHGGSIDELLKYADIAMYKAKDSGRNSYVVYDEQMNEAFTDRVNIEKYLHKALENNEFEVYYQPQMDLKLNRITGIEALLRWNSKELGFVPPDKFIKIAEDTHLIIPIGLWVLRNACDFLGKLHKIGYRDLTVSVNISMLQLFQLNFSDEVIEIIEFYGLKPEFIELEITESVLMKSYNMIRTELEKLSKHGIRIALDDFGMGYSSLSYLKDLPISTLKIDKSFISNTCVSSDKNKNILTGYIIALGKSMGMDVIAEGVECEEQLNYLVGYECNKVQGFLFSKPIPEKELIHLLEEKEFVK